MARHVPRMDEQESDAWLGLVSVLELLPAALDAQLQQDSKLTHFEFMVLSLLQLAPGRVLRMKELAAGTNATLPRLSHVVSRLEGRGLIERASCPEDKRATNARLTDLGRREIVLATPRHVETVRGLVLDQLSREDLAALATVAGKIARNLDPSDRLGQLLGSGTPIQPDSAGTAGAVAIGQRRQSGDLRSDA